MIAAVEPARSTVDTPKTTASMKPRSMMIARSVQVRSAMIACAMASRNLRSVNQLRRGSFLPAC